MDEIKREDKNYPAETYGYPSVREAKFVIAKRGLWLEGNSFSRRVKQQSGQVANLHFSDSDHQDYSSLS